MSAPICEAAAAPVVPGKVCAWCRPGVNALEGHGICWPCTVRELAAAGISLEPRPGPPPHPTSPKEIKHSHE